MNEYKYIIINYLNKKIYLTSKKFREKTLKSIKDLNNLKTNDKINKKIIKNLEKCKDIFLEKYMKNYIELLLTYSQLSENDILKNYNIYIKNAEALIKNQKLSTQIIEKIYKKSSYKITLLLINYQKLDKKILDEIIIKNPKGSFEHSTICFFQHIDDNFVKRYGKYLGIKMWNIILSRSDVKISEKILEKNIKKINKKMWNYVFKYQDLSSNFIQKYKNNIVLPKIKLKYNLKQK